MSEGDQRRLLGLSEDDVEARGSELAVVNGGGGGGNNSNSKGLRDLLRLSGHRQSFKRIEKEDDRDRERDRDRRDQNRHHHDVDLDSTVEVLGDSAPPEWALLLIGCLIGLTTGLFVAFFNKGVHIIHEWVWAGTPIEGAAWLRIQRLADTWHRILLIPVTGGVIVGMMCGLLEILDQIKQSTGSQTQGFDFLAGVFPTIKAIQAAVTLGTGCSLGPEGPSVDIGKSCANGFSLMMEHNRERKIALVAAGAAAGISSGFNAPVAGCFFAIETVLRPLRAENSPPFTTAMIILASVISSTVSNVLQGIKSAFTIPEYDLKSAAELPLYLILGMLCGVISVAMTRLVAWFTKLFKIIQDKFGIPTVVCPALGGFGAGIIALKYPGILYWGFTNVEEILRTGKSASAPGIWLLTQLVVAKVIATALCKGSGLVGGLYAPSLMIGAAAGAVFGGFSAEVINSAIPGNAAVAQPPAYALVGMAATLASVCSVPLTSVLLLFELTKDYRILLPLMGAVGLAIWVPSVTNQGKESDTPDTSSSSRGYSPVSHAGDDNEDSWRQANDGNDLELRIVGNGADHEAIDKELLLENLQVSQAMSKQYFKVLSSATLKDAIKCMHDSQQNCVLVVDKEDFLEGILTYGDIRRCLSQESTDPLKGDLVVLDANTCLVSSVCTRGMSYRGRARGILTCYPNTSLAMAKELMEAKGIKQKVVASTGTVSTVLGKEYVRRNKGRNKGFSANDGVFDMEKAEQFLCSMLGEDCDLNLAVVRDVLCQCGYDIERASNVLLDLAGSTIEKSNTDRHPNYRVDNIGDGRVFVDPNDSLIDRRSESTSISSDGDISDNIWSLGSFGRKYAEVLSNSKVDFAISSECTKSDIPLKVSDIPQKVLESLFNFPKSTEHEKDSMNWRNVVKKIQSLGPGFNVSPHVAESQQRTYAKGDEYHVFREDSNQQWDSVKSYYKKATTAYTKGDRAYAAYLSDQGKEQTKLAQKADTRASHDIFIARNKGIENVITIDLHGQHVKQAIRMLKLHLLFGSYVPSVQTLRVITGCGSHGFGKSKLKQSVIELLGREAIEWREENQGTVLIKLNGWREYSFLDSNSDSDNTD